MLSIITAKKTQPDTLTVHENGRVASCQKHARLGLAKFFAKRSLFTDYLYPSPSYLAPIQLTIIAALGRDNRTSPKHRACNLVTFENSQHVRIFAVLYQLQNPEREQSSYLLSQGTSSEVTSQLSNLRAAQRQVLAIRKRCLLSRRVHLF